MKKAIKLLVSLAAPAVYLLALRYVAPSDQPYFILGIAVVGLVAWLLGTVPGLVATLILIPLTEQVYRQFNISTSYLSFAGSPAYLSMQCLAVLTLGYLRHERTKCREAEQELSEANQRFQGVLSQVKELGGIHNLCGHCKKIQDDGGTWQPIDTYLKEQTKMEFSHCICPDCAADFHTHAPDGSEIRPVMPARSNQSTSV